MYLLFALVYQFVDGGCMYKEDFLVFDHGSVWLKANLC